MKKSCLVLFSALCLLITQIPIKCETLIQANSTVWSVNDDDTPPADFHSIQEAINSASVLDGHTIFVYKGTYIENVVVNKSVSLIGENPALTIIDGNRTGSVISITIDNVKVEGFTVRRSIVGPYGSGIHIDRSSGNVISRNKIMDNYEGIGLYFSHNNLIYCNNISSNSYHGIGFLTSNNNTISGNAVYSNTNNGLYLVSSSNNLIVNNTIFSNRLGEISRYDGIILSSSSNNFVVRNNISDNGNGISLYSSSNNVISSNTLSLNNYSGLYLALYSGSNSIYHNNFYDNVETNELANIWDNDYEGNYWHDYAGQDLNRDGIGDTFHVIDINNMDKYPLMGRFSHFEVALKDATHSVNIICNSILSDFRFEVGAETGNKIIRFNVSGVNGTAGFCRITIPTRLMEYPFVVIVGDSEVTPTPLGVSNSTHICLYFSYVHSNLLVSIISSKTLQLYYDLMEKYNALLEDMQALNASYYDLLDKYDVLGGNHSQLQDDYDKLNESYQEHLSNYSESVKNLRNLVYIFAGTTAIFILTTIYLSKNAHANAKKQKPAEAER